MFENLLEKVTTYAFATLLFLIPLCSSAQSSDIKGTFDQIMEDHATWEKYKVVPVTKMEQFGVALGDTLTKKENKIAGLQNEVSTLKTKLDTANARIASLNGSLGASEERNDQISFLGIDFSKVTYNSIVWGKIFILIGLLLFTYYMYKRSNLVTTSARRDLEVAKAELEAQKEKAREKEIKLKRDLQTAMNKLYENGIQV